MTKEQLQEAYIDEQKKVLSLEKRLKKCRQKDSKVSAYVRYAAGGVCIVSAQWIPKTDFTAAGISGNLIVMASLLMMFVPTLWPYYIEFREGRKARKEGQK